jgi:hypothetical protein
LSLLALSAPPAVVPGDDEHDNRLRRDFLMAVVVVVVSGADDRCSLPGGLCSTAAALTGDSKLTNSGSRWWSFSLCTIC